MSRTDQERRDARPVRLSARDRREQYLDVAAEIAIRSGVALVTMEGVAVGAGVNKALLYRQFDNRGELLLALFDRETAKLDARVRAAVDDAEGFEAKIRAWAGQWFDNVAEHGALLGRLMEARTVAPEVAARHKERLRAVERLYGDWYAEQLDVEVEVGRDAAAMLFAGLSGIIDRWVAAPNTRTRRRLERTYVDLVLGGLQRLSERS